MGLGGSSALVVATMQAALRCWGLEVPPHELAEAALMAETDELGIAAGLADRVAQVWQRTVLTDCRGSAPSVTVVPVHGEPEVLLTWSDSAAAPSGRYHGDLRARVDDGTPGLDEVLAGLAELADAAAHALTTGDQATFAGAVDDSLRARCALGHVPEAALEPVEALRRGGASVNFAGSGGSLVVVGGRAEPPPGWDARVVLLA